MISKLRDSPHFFSPSFCFVRVLYLTGSFTVPKHLNSLFFFFCAFLSFVLFFLSFIFHFSFPLPTYIQTDSKVLHSGAFMKIAKHNDPCPPQRFAYRTVHTVGPAGGCFSRFSLTHPSTLQLALFTGQVWLRNAQAGR